MNIFADENVDRPIVERLKQDGHDVWYVFDNERGISDDIMKNYIIHFPLSQKIQSESEIFKSHPPIA